MGDEDQQESGKSNGPTVSIGEFLHENSDLLSLFGILSGVSVAFPRLLSQSNEGLEAGVSGALLVLVVLSGVLLYDLSRPLGEALLQGHWTQLMANLFLVVGLCGITVAVVLSLVQYLPFLLPLFDKIGFLIIFLVYFLFTDSRFHIDRIRGYEGDTLWATLARNSSFFGLAIILLLNIYFFQYIAYRLPFVNKGYSVTIGLVIMVIVFFVATLLCHVIFSLLDTLSVHFRNDERGA